jgi:hypothetical protein
MGQAASRQPVTGETRYRSWSMWDVCRTKWHWDRIVPDTLALGRLCRTRWHWDRFVQDTVAMGQVCAAQSGTGAGLCRAQWHWDRFLTDYVDCPPSGSLQQCTILTYISIFTLTLARRASECSLGTFKQGAILSVAATGSTVPLLLDERNVAAD